MRRFLVTLLLTLPLTAANLVQNPGFEVPVLDSGTYLTFTAPDTIPGWTWDGPGNGLLLRTDYAEGPRLFPAYEGQNSMDMTGAGWTGNNVIWQDITTVIGQRYLLRFALGNQDDNLDSYSKPSALEVTLNGNSAVTASLAHNGNSSVLWGIYSTYFVADSTTTRLAFRNITDPSDAYAGLDDVFVEEAPETVPEPATMAVAAAALLGVGIVKQLRPSWS